MSPRPPDRPVRPRLVMHGFYGAGNIGDEAILAATAALVAERLPEAQLMVVSHDPRQTEQAHPVMAIDHHDLHGQSAVLGQADVLLFGGGCLCNDYWQGPPASLFDDAWGGLPYYLRLPLLARLHEVPVVVYAQGVGPLASVAARRMVRFVFDQAADISVRDRRSAELLRELGVGPAVDISADPAFVLEPDHREAKAALQKAGLAAGRSPLIGVSVRPFPSFTPGRLKLLAEAVAEFAKQVSGRIVLLPFCYRGPNRDLDICKAFAEALGPEALCTLIESELSPRGMLGLIGHLDLLVATRYHAGVFAMRQSVPFLAVSYDPKVDSLATESGIPAIKTLSLTSLHPGRIAPMLAELWAKRDELRAELAQAVAVRQQQVRNTIDRVCHLAETSHRAMSSGADRRPRPLWVPEAGTKSARTLLAEARADTDRLRKVAEEAQRQAEKLIEQVRNKTDQVDALQRQLADALSRVADLEARCRVAEEKTRQQAARLAQLQSDNEQLIERVTRMESDAFLLKEKVRDQTTEVKTLHTRLARARSELEQSQQQVNDDLRQIAKLETGCQTAEARLREQANRLAQLQAAHEQLKKKLSFTQERYRGTAEQLQQIWDSRGFQLLNRLYNHWFTGGIWRLTKRILPVRFKEYLKLRARRSVAPAAPVAASTQPTADANPAGETRQAPAQPPAPDTPQPVYKPRSGAEVIQDLERFLEQVDQSQAPDLVVFLAGVKYIESEGQRVTQIIRALIARSVPVLLIYFRWQSEYHQPVPRSHDRWFFQLPIDLFEPHRKTLIDYPLRSSLRRTCIFEFPYPSTFQWVNEFNLAQWKTLYDIIDDWEEFHAAGKAVWYEPEVEHYLCANCSTVTAIVPLLAEKAERWVPGLQVRLVPNGVSPDSFDMTLPRKALPGGTVTVGYFGYLTPAWFDWQMVADIAARHPDWTFHIIGYGERVPVKLTDNVQLLGKVHHHELYAYTQNWDVAIVPFKPTALSRGADPIKVYEYLTLGLPVVSADIPHLRSYPNVYVASSSAEFEEYIERAARDKPPPEATQAFIRKSTWYQRGLDLIAAAHDGRAEPLVAAACLGNSS